MTWCPGARLLLIGGEPCPDRCRSRNFVSVGETLLRHRPPTGIANYSYKYDPGWRGDLSPLPRDFARDLGEVEVDRQGAGELAVNDPIPPSPCV